MLYCYVDDGYDVTSWMRDKDLDVDTRRRFGYGIKSWRSAWHGIPFFLVAIWTSQSLYRAG